MEPDSSPEENPKIPESLTDRPDGWLLREWKAGDERAAEVLFDRYAIRLVALVGSRLNRSYQASIDPNDVVQSAMGSFFDAARHSRIEVSRSVSLWRLLATFARRKMARSIERQSAVKRGGDQVRVSLDSVQPQIIGDHDSESEDDADAFLMTLKAELPDDLFVIVEGILAGQTHRELAESLGIDERTVRRRLSRVRERLAPNVARHERNRTRRRQSADVAASELQRVRARQIDRQRWFRQGLSCEHASRWPNRRRKIPSQGVLAERCCSPIVPKRDQPRLANQTSRRHPLPRLRRITARWSVRHQRVD